MNAFVYSSLHKLLYGSIVDMSSNFGKEATPRQFKRQDVEHVFLVMGFYGSFHIHKH